MNDPMTGVGEDRRIAAMSQSVSVKMYEDFLPGRLALLRFMREKMTADIRALLPGARIHWVFSRSYPRTMHLQAIASRDDAAALALATKARKVRRQWAGYRTDMDWMADTR